MQQSITSPYFLKLLPICTGNLRAILVPAYFRDKFSFCKKKVYRIVCLFVFVALRPMSTAMVIAGRSVHLNTLFPGQA